MLFIRGTLALAALTELTFALPFAKPSISGETSDVIASTQPMEASPVDDLSKRQQKFLLRILPLGASIMYGVGSTHGNGARQTLRHELMQKGFFDVDFVGSRSCTKDAQLFPDNQCEGWPGATIWETQQNSAKAFKFKPNVVLINAGSNNCMRENKQPENAEKLMRDLIENMMKQPGFENTFFVVSTLTPFKNNKDDCRQMVNRGLRECVRKMKEAGKRVWLADMNGQYAIKHPNNFADDLHPNDSGHRLMALTWFSTILSAYEQGKIATAVPL